MSAAPKAIGFRCTHCNYARDSFVGLKAGGQEDLERGICTACGERGIALIFSETQLATISDLQAKAESARSRF